MPDEHVEDAVAGFLLGALEPAEDEAVREHIVDCDGCFAAMVAARDVLRSLAEAPPSSHVRVGLLTRAGSERSRVARRHNWMAPALGAAAAVVVVSLSTAAILLARGGSDPSNSLIPAVTGSAQVLTMRGTENAPGVTAALLVPEDGEGVTVLASNVPPAPEGEGYHLWLFADGEPHSGGALVPDDDGLVLATIESVRLTEFERMEVDVQPVGAGAPGGVMVLGGDLP